MDPKRLYLIGSLRNPQVPIVGDQLREDGFEVFDQWHSAGPNADEHWRDYEVGRGHSFIEALQSREAWNTYRFDFVNLAGADLAVLLLPAGKSGHLELGWVRGQGKPGYIVLDPTSQIRYDVMYLMATKVFNNVEDLRKHLQLGYSI